MECKECGEETKGDETERSGRAAFEKDTMTAITHDEMIEKVEQAEGEEEEDEDEDVKEIEISVDPAKEPLLSQPTTTTTTEGTFRLRNVCLERKSDLRKSWALILAYLLTEVRI